MVATMDEYQGQGGSYVLDKKTGKRKLVERTAAECNLDQPLTEAPTNGTAQPQTPDPGEN
jgi:hypothetical protein